MDHIDFAQSSDRRVTRQMSKRQRRTSNLDDEDSRNVHSNDDLASYEVLLLAFSDNISENTNFSGTKWLSKQDFATNCIKSHECYICLEKLNDNEVVYNIKCDGVFKHPIHIKCAKLYIDNKGTTCPVCRGVWE